MKRRRLMLIDSMALVVQMIFRSRSGNRRRVSAEPNCAAKTGRCLGTGNPIWFRNPPEPGQRLPQWVPYRRAAGQISLLTGIETERSWPQTGYTTIQSGTPFSLPRSSKIPSLIKWLSPVLVEEKKLRVSSTILRAPFSGVFFLQTERYFSLVFSSQASIRMSARTGQYQRIFL